MKRLFFFSGSADSSFIKNEIVVLKEFFDDICIISYPMSKELFRKILKDNGIRGYMVPQWKLSPPIIKNFIKWFLQGHVRSEIKNHTSLSKKGIKRFFYILHYGLSVVNSYSFFEKEMGSKADNCDIYLYAFWMSRPAYMAVFFNCLYKEKITKVVARAHGYDLYEERNSMDYLPFRQFISANMDEIHFISDNGRSYFKNRTCVKYHIAEMPKLFLDYLGTYNTRGVKKEIRDKTKVVIASCAFVSSVKRLDLIIDFLSIIKGIDVKWIHIGGGKLLNEIKILAKDRIPYIDVHFYGNMENEMILPVYEKEDVDFFINLSDSEGLPVSIMEAMSMGIPVIARNVGGINEIVNADNGCLLEGTGIDEKEKVRQFVMMRLESVSEYRRFSENAIRTWEDKYSAEVNYRRFCEEIVNGQWDVDN